MKIQQVTKEHHAKVYALLRAAFPGRGDEAALVQKLHENGRPLQEWVCIHINKAIAYIAFSNAYHGEAVCGLHLAPLAVAPEFQRQGVGSELLRFALRQEAIRSQSLFVLGKPGFFQRFGFAPCRMPSCPLTSTNRHFQALRLPACADFTVGYEPEFKPAAGPPLTTGTGSKGACPPKKSSGKRTKEQKS
jgi:putative acetyltransferase